MKKFLRKLFGIKRKRRTKEEIAAQKKVKRVYVKDMTNPHWNRKKKEQGAANG